MLFDEESLQLELEEVLERFSNEIKKIRTGRATMELFDGIDVPAYGTNNKLTAVSNVIIEDAISVKVNIWDKSIMPNVEESLRESNIGATVIMEGDFIRLRFSPLTEEKRKENVKILKQELEDRKVAMRQIRQKFMKEVESQDGVSEDDQERDQNKIQEHIDAYIAKLDEIAKNKEEALMSV